MCIKSLYDCGHIIDFECAKPCTDIIRCKLMLAMTACPKCYKTTVAVISEEECLGRAKYNVYDACLDDE